MTKEQFIQEIAKAAQKYAPKYGISTVSPCIAQACLESGYGTSNKAQYHNYFGLKYRPGRLTCNSGCFKDKSKEQKPDGTYIDIETSWYMFDSLDAGVEGYFQFINTSNYANLKGVTDPFEYLKRIKEDGYATSQKYVDNVSSVIRQWNLQQYDNIQEVKVMGYTNSPLAVYTKLSPNHSGQRTHKLDRITPHCVVGQLTAERIADCFPTGRNASCNYGVGYDGRISLIVEEKNRSWCTSSAANDQRAITIEVSSDKTHPYAFMNEAYKGLVALCIDICKRNGFNKVLWFADKAKSIAYEPKQGECVFTVHRWFDAKACPGDWLYAKMGDLTAAVNAAISGNVTVPTVTPAPQPVTPTQPAQQETMTEKLYRVQCGAFGKKENAEKLLKELNAKGWQGFITYVGNLYKVQLGAYTVQTNAENLMNKLKASGFSAFVTTVIRADEAFIPRKSAEEIAEEIWTGKCSDSRWSTWGTGEERRTRLQAAGYNYDAVQLCIIKMYG